MRKPTLLISILLCLSLAALIEGPGRTAQRGERDRTRTVRDLMWVWGNPEMAKEGEHTAATFAEAGPLQRARLLGVPNVVMAGMGLPNEERKGEQLTREVASAPRLVWEVTADDVPEGQAGGFVYRSRMTQLKKLVDRYPQIEGVLLDDMTSVGIDKGFKPEHIRHVRDQLPGKYGAVKVWGVVYTMNFNRPNLDAYIRELDVINLWTWHAKDVVNLEQNVAHVERLFPDKPIVVGLYLYDYGGGRRIPRDLLQQQCETALKLARAGRIRGIVFLTINNDQEAVDWTAAWIKQVGAQKVASEARK
jgi:hypothetical protein